MGLGGALKKIVGGVGKAVGIGGGGGAPQMPGIDPAYQNAQNALTNEAINYRGAIPGMANAQSAVDRGATRRNLASAMQKTKSGFGGRGLLYSGLRRSDEAGASDEAASGLASRRATLNENLLGNASEMERSAIAGGQDLAMQKAGGAATNLDTQIQALKQRQAGLSSLGQGIGGIAGMYAASDGTKKPITRAPNTGLSSTTYGFSNSGVA